MMFCFVKFPIDFQEALSLTEFELMEVLDVGLAEVTSAIARISEITCPPYQTVRIETLIFSFGGFSLLVVTWDALALAVFD